MPRVDERVKVRKSAEPEVPKITLPQARVLKPLVPSYEDDPPEMWPLFTRVQLNVRVGYSPISTGITRPLRGIPPGSSSGKAQPGLLALGLVEVVTLDIDGVQEDSYRITALGIKAFHQYMKEAGGQLPDLIPAESRINKRYRKQEEVSNGDN